MLRSIFQGSGALFAGVRFLFRIGRPLWLAHRAAARGENADEARAAAVRGLCSLGPSHIKLGQFLATRPDLIGVDWSRALMRLQDRLDPFDDASAQAAVSASLERPWNEVYASFSSAQAAASVAQVHRATIADEGAPLSEVAVKVLRPGVEARLARDFAHLGRLAAMAEACFPSWRRLRPCAAVSALAFGARLEMDLRLEAAALQELAENRGGDEGFRVPAVDWDRTSRRVLTLEWVEGIALSDLEGLAAAGHDLGLLGRRLVRSFLRQALEDGFFHADLHGGNVIVEPDGTLVALDCGIMGRLSVVERRFTAEILHGFVMRDYLRVARIHREAGYLPAHHDIASFAQALRAIGEPIADRGAERVSMGRLLRHLFEVSDYYDMRLQPQLLLLQKTMIVVEGAARRLDSGFNIWGCAREVLSDWPRREPERAVGDLGRSGEALRDLASRTASQFPEMAERAIRLVARADEAEEENGASIGGGFWSGVLVGVVAATLLWMI